MSKYWLLILPLFPCVPAIFQKCTQRPKIRLNFMLISWFCDVFSFNPREIDLRPKWTPGAQICVLPGEMTTRRPVGRVGTYYNYILGNHLTCAHNNIKKENEYHTLKSRETCLLAYYGYNECYWLVIYIICMLLHAYWMWILTTTNTISTYLLLH